MDCTTSKITVFTGQAEGVQARAPKGLALGLGQEEPAQEESLQAPSQVVKLNPSELA